MDKVIQRIQNTPETELEFILGKAVQKVDELAKLLHFDRSMKDFFHRILIMAVSLYFTMEESAGSLKEGENLDACIKLLKDIPSADMNKVQQTMYLSRDISREYFAVTGKMSDCN